MIKDLNQRIRIPFYGTQNGIGVFLTKNPIYCFSGDYLKTNLGVQEVLTCENGIATFNLFNGLKWVWQERIPDNMIFDDLTENELFLAIHRNGYTPFIHTTRVIKSIGQHKISDARIDIAFPLGKSVDSKKSAELYSALILWESNRFNDINILNSKITHNITIKLGDKPNTQIPYSVSIIECQLIESDLWI